MFGIRKKGREQAAKLHGIIRDNVAPYVARLSDRIRFPARRRLANRWGRQNPKKVVAMYAGFAVVAIAWNCQGLFPFGETHARQDPLGFSKMTAVANPFDGMAEINMNREAIRSSLTDVAEANMKLAQRLDSLCSLRALTRQDSLEIVRIYRKLNNNKDNPNEPKTD